MGDAGPEDADASSATATVTASDTRRRSTNQCLARLGWQRLVAAGNLIENATFDAKAALPDKGKSKDLAKDVAAMANNGGTSLYAVGEDEYR